MSVRERLLKAGERSPFSALVRIQLKSEFGIRGLSEKLGLGKRPQFVYLYLALLGIALMSFFGVLYSMFYSFAEMAMLLGQPGLVVMMTVAAGQALVVFVGISGIMSILYDSRDLETLQAMPFTPKQIMSAKVLCAYFPQLLSVAFVALPSFIALGSVLDSPLFWVSAPFIVLATPCIPTALSLILVVPLMKLTSRSKRRDFFRVVLGLVFFALVIGFQYVNMNMVKDPQGFVQLLMERNGIIQALSVYYPPLRWAALATTSDAPLTLLANLVLYVGVSVAALVLVTSVSQRWFLGGIARDVRRAAPAAKGKAGAREVSIGGGSLLMSLIAKEHRTMVRNSNWLLVTLTNLTIVPLMLLISSFGAGKGELSVALEQLRTMIPTEFLVLAVAAVQGLTVSLNQVASTGLSREGTLFFLSKTLPVSPRVQARAKLLYSMGFALVQLVILMASFVFILRPDPITLALTAGLALLVSWPVSALCLINDLMSPKLKWTNPQQAMKGNFNTLIAGIFSAAYLAAFYFGVRALYPRVLTGWALYGLVGAALLVTGVLLHRGMESFAVSRYKSIEL
ncbi:MAG TPA: hypothetical protein GXX23_05385 [Firmicutes bacterium]|nr:hypothetical protein [Candidatus Fermentithermobacillaceae bacterium]